MTKTEASQLVAILFGSYPTAHLERRHVDAYVTGIVDLPANAAAEAITRLRRTSRFLPSIAEIREACTAQTRGATRTGEEAYAELTLAVRRHGRDYGQGTPKFRDPLIARCLGVWGSWNDLCGSPVDDPGGRARFIELYDELAGRERQDLAAGKPLPKPESTGPAFWLERGRNNRAAEALVVPKGAAGGTPKANGNEPDATRLRTGAPAAPADQPVAQLVAALAPRKPSNPGPAPAPRRWTAEEIDAALASSQQGAA